MNVASVMLTLAATVSLLRDPIFESPAGLTFSRELLWTNRSGAFDGTERAAFVVDRGNGVLECLLWPAMHQHNQETFHGLMPPGTVAIIHTHPFSMPMPSPQDAFESSRLGIPIYALTPRMVTKAVPSRFDPVIVHRGSWFVPPPRPRQCKPL